ncbi:MAG: HAMP domain-containing sensor histidine kinase [Candidatus Paceibacterota bacterium]|jgi:signal transduction histidine kinase
MNKITNWIKGIFLTIYLIIIVIILILNPSISSVYGLPIWIIPTIAFVSVILFGYSYTKTLLSVNSIENEFTSIVNHVFRTPLTRIMWLEKELEKDLPTQERLLNLQNLENAGARVLEIIDIIAGIKDVKSRAGYLFKATSLREIVEKLIIKYHGEIDNKKITMRIPTFNNIPMLTLDLKKISFVIDVLLENAIFYTPEGGKIFMDCVVKDKKLFLSVSDSGMGLSFLDKMRIFSRFYRSKKAKLMNTDGLGLGLYLSKIIVSRHHGKIYVTSSGVDKGAEFVIELPLK